MKNVFFILGLMMLLITLNVNAQKGYFEKPEKSIQIEWVNKADFEALAQTTVNATDFSHEGYFHFVNNSGQPLLVKIGGERHELINGEQIKISSSEKADYGLQIFQVSNAARYAEVYNQTISIQPGNDIVYEALPELLTQ